MEFSVTNYKGIRDVAITASHGDLVIVAGRNGAGKSSFIDAITELFDARGTRLTPRPIREGESKAVAEYVDEVLDVKVRRTWTKDDAGKLEVHALDGAKYPKPADVLARLTGGLIFDPGRFLQLDEKRQRDELLAKVELPFDLDALERTAAGARDRRLEAGREVKRLQGALATIPAPGGDVPAEPVSAADIVQELEAAAALQRRYDDEDEEDYRRASTISRLEAEAEEIRKRIETLKTDDAQARFDRATREPVPDVDALRARLAGVEETNEAVRQAARHREVAAELAAAEAAHKAAEADLATVDEQKAAGLAAAEWPDPDLGVDETGVTIAGIPFRQVNTARRILAAARIATSGDPELRLVIVSNGDLLDDESLAAVQALASERGFTVIMERDRDDSREVGFEIVEGRLVD